MKKFITKLFTSLTHYGLILILLYAVSTGTQSLLGLIAATYWVIMSLGIFIGPLLYILSHAAKNKKDEESGRKAMELVSNAVKKKNAFLRALGWFELIVISCLLAYSGWIFTAVCYVLSSFYLRLFISMARDNIASVRDPQEVA